MKGTHGQERFPRNRWCSGLAIPVSAVMRTCCAGTRLARSASASSRSAVSRAAPKRHTRVFALPEALGRRGAGAVPDRAAAPVARRTRLGVGPSVSRRLRHRRVATGLSGPDGAAGEDSGYGPVDDRGRDQCGHDRGSRSMSRVVAPVVRPARAECGGPAQGATPYWCSCRPWVPGAPLRVVNCAAAGAGSASLSRILQRAHTRRAGL